MTDSNRVNTVQAHSTLDDYGIMFTGRKCSAWLGIFTDSTRLKAKRLGLSSAQSGGSSNKSALRNKSQRDLDKLGRTDPTNKMKFRIHG